MIDPVVIPEDSDDEDVGAVQLVGGDGGEQRSFQKNSEGEVLQENQEHEKLLRQEDGLLESEKTKEGSSSADVLQENNGEREPRHQEDDGRCCGVENGQEISNKPPATKTSPTTIPSHSANGEQEQVSENSGEDSNPCGSNSVPNQSQQTKTEEKSSEDIFATSRISTGGGAGAGGESLQHPHLNRYSSPLPPLHPKATTSSHLSPTRKNDHNNNNISSPGETATTTTSSSSSSLSSFTTPSPPNPFTMKKSPILGFGEKAISTSRNSPSTSPMTSPTSSSTSSSSSSSSSAAGVAIPFSAVRLKKDVLSSPKLGGALSSLGRVEEAEKTDTEFWVKRIGEIVDASKGLGKPAKVLSFLLVGGVVDATDTMKMKLLGVTHLVNCCSLQAKSSGGPFPCLEIPADDNEDYDILQHLEQVKEFVDAAHRGGGKVLVHCFAGQNRSVALAVAYAAERSRQPILKLIEAIAKDRRLVLNNISFRRQLIEWAQKKDLRLV